MPRPRRRRCCIGRLWNAAIEQDVQGVEPGEAPRRRLRQVAQATAAAGPVSILISGANQELYALQNGIEVITSPVTIADPQAPAPTFSFSLVRLAGRRLARGERRQAGRGGRQG